MIAVREFGTQNPVGYLPECDDDEEYYRWTTGSGYMASPVIRVHQDLKWKCHYCGSKIGIEKEKCRNCGGERR